MVTTSLSLYRQRDVVRAGLKAQIRLLSFVRCLVAEVVSCYELAMPIL